MIRFMGKIRRGGYIFITWKGDHAPRHVHVFEQNRLIAKFDLENWKVIQGQLSKKLLLELIALRKEDRL